MTIHDYICMKCLEMVNRFPESGMKRHHDFWEVPHFLHQKDGICSRMPSIFGKKTWGDEFQILIKAFVLGVYVCTCHVWAAKKGEHIILQNDPGKSPKKWVPSHHVHGFKQKNCYSWFIINMKIDWTLLYDIQHTNWQSVPFQAGVEIQAFRNNCFVWVGHHRRKSSKKPQREMKKCLKILRTTFQAKNIPASISVFFPWLHSTQLLIASPVCFIFICIICIIILILILILLNIMFMMKLYCGNCFGCPGRGVGQMRSPSFPKHLFESFWKSNTTLSPVLGRNGGNLYIKFHELPKDALGSLAHIYVHIQSYSHT